MRPYVYNGKIHDLAEPAPVRTASLAGLRLAGTAPDDVCGTLKMYKRHLRRGDAIDEACRAAAQEYMRDWRAANRPTTPRLVGEFDPGFCGSDKGYHRPRRQGTPPCAPCRAGHAAVAAEYAARRAA